VSAGARCALGPQLLSADGWRRVCEFEAADAEAIRASLREAQTPFDRVWPGQLIT
jgi:hypothetical protein